MVIKKDVKLLAVSAVFLVRASLFPVSMQNTCFLRQVTVCPHTAFGTSGACSRHLQILDRLCVGAGGEAGSGWRGLLIWSFNG